MSDPRKILFVLPILVAVFMAAGVFLGKKMAENTNQYWSEQERRVSSHDKLHQILSFIKSEYVDSVEEQLILENTISELLHNLDPHSSYISGDMYDYYNDPLEGNFEGIGIEFRIRKDTVIVVRALGGGPSEKVGLLAGDRIVEVEGENITGKSINNNKVVRLLKGPKGTEVNLKVKRTKEKKLIAYTVTRDEIPYNSVEAYYMLNDKIGYIKLSRFARTSHQEFKDAVDHLQEKGMESLVFDLRNNSGGLMKAAIDIADEFLPKGDLIVYTKGKSRAEQQYKATTTESLANTPIVILINEGSASASEIVAGAIQDHDRGLIIGRRSFGKGLVQESVQWPDGSAVRLTVARYYTPSGRCIQKSYEEGLENYYEETMHRYESGELLSRDSITFPDSLKYRTDMGRVVYGGGGIMPDVFVPIDTSLNSLFYRQLNYMGIFYQFGFQYVDQHRSWLRREYKNGRSYLKEFVVDEKLWEEFIAFAASKGITRQDELSTKIRELSEVQLVASIGRNLFDESLFFEVINKADHTVQQAIEKLQNKNSLSHLPSPVTTKGIL
jgi:carboxyl-terminal processing protease